jgi:ATP-dependent Clp protease ATP-binding subunit ClpA
MHEQYTEEAKRSIFFAQYEASRLNSPLVETEHLLLGILRENPAFFERFQISGTSIRNLIHKEEANSAGISMGLSNMPLTDESKDVLSSAKEEADLMFSKDVGIEHLLLGLLQDEDCTAAQILRKCGASLNRIRAELEVAPYQHPSDEVLRGRAIGELDELIASVSSRCYPSSKDASSLTDRFLKFSEKARRAIFFAQYEASQFHSPAVETYQLLLGVLREGVPRVDLFMPLGLSRESLHLQIEEYAAVREKVSVSPGLPLSEECERALTNAEEEAAELKHKQVGLEHLLLGLLREEGSFAAQLLRERGAEIGRIRSGLTASPNQPPSNPADPSQPSEPAA